MAATGSRRLMAFHQPFLNRVAGHFPDADLLLGKGVVPLRQVLEHEGRVDHREEERDEEDRAVQREEAHAGGPDRDELAFYFVGLDGLLSKKRP